MGQGREKEKERENCKANVVKYKQLVNVEHMRVPLRNFCNSHLKSKGTKRILSQFALEECVGSQLVTAFTSPLLPYLWPASLIYGPAWPLWANGRLSCVSSEVIHFWVQILLTPLLAM